MTRNTHKQRVLTAFMASYSLLLLIPVIMGLVVFVMASCILRSDTLTTSSRVLENAVQTIESAYDTASDLTLGISTSRDFCRRLDEVQPGDKYAIAELAGMASALHTSNNLISRYFLYYHGSDDAQFVLEESRAYADLDVYYKACFQYGALDSEQFFTGLRLVRQTVFFPAARTHDLYGNVSEAVLLVIPFRKSSSTFRGHMAFYFDKKLMEKNLAPLLEGGATYVCLRAADGTTLMELGEPTLRPDQIPENAAALGHTSVRTAQGVQHLLCSRAESSGITVLATIPDCVFIARNASLLLPVGVGIGLFLLVAAALTFAVSRYNRKPLSQIVDLLPMEGDSADGGLWPVKQAVEKLLLDQEKLSGLLGVRDTQLRDATVSQLVKGSFHSEQELELQLTHTGIRLEGDAWRGVYMTLPRQAPFGEERMERLNYRYMMVTGTLSAFAPALQFLTLKTSSEYILLYTQAGDKPMEELLTEAATALRDHCGVEAVFYAGIACESLSTLNQSFASARALMPGSEEDGRVVYVAQRRPLNKAVYDYTAQDENALIACVQSADAEGVRRVLDAVRERNFLHRSLSAYMCQSLYMAMLHTLSRFDCPLILPSRLMNVPLRMEPEQFFAELADIYDSLIEQTQSGRRRASMMLMENVLQYIAENYRDPNLSLTMLAQHFGLTEPYLSKRFKQHVGVNFSAYLEQQRISRAHELLRTTGMSVQAISDSVGYANIRSFRRAYIRVVGCPPSADRGGEEDGARAREGE